MDDTRFQEMDLAILANAYQLEKLAGNNEIGPTLDAEVSGLSGEFFTDWANWANERALAKYAELKAFKEARGGDAAADSVSDADLVAYAKLAYEVLSSRALGVSLLQRLPALLAEAAPELSSEGHTIN